MKDDDIEIFRRVHLLEKQLKPSPEEVFVLHLKLIAAIFIRDTSPEEEITLLGVTAQNFLSESDSLIHSMMHNSVRIVKDQGITKDNANNYIKNLLLEFENKSSCKI